jgi:predicted SAM-dependent methyltransferase
MHPTAFQNAQTFVDTYCSTDISENSIVIDFGAYDVNGSLRDLFEPKYKYIGIDQSEGPNVDIVCSNRKTPFNDNYADVIVSTSCFEHDECFWMTFIEMCRILKPGGILYINVPSAGYYHGYPGDCWRFYADSWKALASWAKEHDYTMNIVESYIDPRGEWKDAVGILRKV